MLQTGKQLLVPEDKWKKVGEVLWIEGAEPIPGVVMVVLGVL